MCSCGALAALAFILYPIVGPGRNDSAVTALAGGADLAVASAVVLGGQFRFGWCLTRRDWHLRKDNRAHMSEIGGIDD